MELFQFHAIASVLEGYGLCHTCDLLFANRWSAVWTNTPWTNTPQDWGDDWEAALGSHMVAI